MWNYSKCIHVHVPKTGGNSVSAALQAAWRAKPRIERLTLRLRHGGKQGFSKGRGIRKHAKARDIRLVIGQRSWDEHFSFAFVRNPWDLMVSSYSWWVSRAERFEEARQAALEIKALGSFSRFMDSVYGREQINEQRGNLSDWICEDDGRILVDVVGRFERLEEDWTYIAHRLGIDAQLPHRNRGNRGEYRAYYDGTSRDIVAQRFAWAIDRFEYSF